MKNPLVSIIIPCYNYEKYVKEAIESAINQTYKNTEIIVINDGSTDGSDNVINELKKLYGFRYYSQKNAGIVGTRNRAIELAEGDFIIQLDADDALPKDYTEVLTGYAKKNRADIYYTPAKDLDTGEIVINPPEFDIEILKHHNYMHGSSMVRAELIQKYNYDKKLNDKGLEDWDIYLSMCLDGAKGVLVKEVAILYRKHQDRKSRSDELNNSDKELAAIRYILTKQITNHAEKMSYMMPYLHFVDRLLIFSRENNQLKNQIRDQKEVISQLQKKIDIIKKLPPVKGYLAVKKIFK